jgi:hypothetical protein
MAKSPKPGSIIELAQRPESPFWQLKWYDPECRKVCWRSTRTESRAEAEKQRAIFTLSDHHPTEADPPPKEAVPAGLTVREALGAYLREHAENIPSAEQARIAIRHLENFMGDEQVAQIDDLQQQEYVDHRDELGIAPRTISRELSVLRAAFRHAVRKKMIIEAPKVYDLPEVVSIKRWLTPDQFKKLDVTCTLRHIRIYMRLAVTTAARPRICSTCDGVKSTSTPE